MPFMLLKEKSKLLTEEENGICMHVCQLSSHFLLQNIAFLHIENASIRQLQTISKHFTESTEQNAYLTLAVSQLLQNCYCPNTYKGNFSIS